MESLGLDELSKILPEFCFHDTNFEIDEEDGEIILKTKKSYFFLSRMYIIFKGVI